MGKLSVGYMTSNDYLIVMKRVGIADLKARLSEHLRYVRRGHRLTILDRDTPVAEVRPVSTREPLAVRSPAGRRPLGRIPLGKPLGRTVDVVALLREERGER